MIFFIFVFACFCHCLNSIVDSNRIVDFSFAGFRLDGNVNSEKFSNDVFDVATKDWKTVDLELSSRANFTLALQALLDSIEEQTVLQLPSGEFELTSRVQFKRSQIVVRGSKQSPTKIVIKKPLSETNPPGKYQYNGGFFSASGNLGSSKPLATVVRDASKFSNQIVCRKTDQFNVNDTIRITQSQGEIDDKNSLMYYLCGGSGDSSDCNLKDLKSKKLFDFVVDITRLDVDSKNSSLMIVELARRLPIEIKTSWQAQIELFAPTMHSIGIEHLTIEFQPDPIQFLGHFAAVGLNAIEFSRVYNSFVRHLTIINADTAIHLTHSHFCTISNIEFQHTENRYK